MAVTVTNLDELQQGDTWRFEAIDIKNDGVALDLRGCQLFFTLRSAVKDANGNWIEDADDSEAVAKADVSVSNGASPVYQFPDIVISNTLTNIPLGSYYYDFQVKLANGDILTMNKGKTKVVYQVTQRTA